MSYKVDAINVYLFAFHRWKALSSGLNEELSPEHLWQKCEFVFNKFCIQKRFVIDGYDSKSDKPYEFEKEPKGMCVKLHKEGKIAFDNIPVSLNGKNLTIKGFACPLGV